MADTILVIEHNEREARNIRERLSALGFDVCDAFPSLEAALATPLGHKPELALIDIDHCASTIWSELRHKIRDVWGCPVIFTTSHSETLQERQSSGATGDILLLKPIKDDSELNLHIQLSLKQHELEQSIRECRSGLLEKTRPSANDSYTTHRMETLIAEVARLHTNLQQNRLSRGITLEPLLYSEILFKTIFHRTPVGIALVSISDEFIMVNSTFGDFLGYGRHELMNMGASEIVHPADIFTDTEKRESPAAGRPPVEYCDKRFLRKDGRFVLGHVSVTAIEDDTGRTIFYLWQVEDITAQKRVEHERLKLESIVEHSPDLIAMITVSGHFRYLNPAGLKLIGATQAAHLLAISDITDPTAQANTLVRLCEKVRQQGLWNCELELRRLKDGTPIPVAAHGFILNSPTPTSQPIIAVIARDLTETKRREQEHQALQDQLIRSEKMQSLGLLAGGVAHDLNNILGPLVAYPDLILRKLPSDSPLRQQIERMRDSACNAADVVQDLLTLARRGRHEQAPVNMNSVIEGFLNSPLVENLKAEYPQTTIVTSLSEIQPVVLGSAAQLEKIIMNLVVNSFDAITGDGTITITTGKRDLIELLTGYADIAPGVYAFVSIKDTGIGIEKDNVKRIFEPYYSTKKLKGRSGTGLGLAIVYGILKDHRGYYDLISEPGKGTEFIVYLPQAAVSSEPAGPHMNLGGSERLLVVDDDPQQREVARECLQGYGYSVTTVASGRLAVELLKKENFDLVLLDMIMESDFDGLDTYRALKALKGSVKAIIVSGSAATERVREAQRLGVGRYVQKPYTAEELVRAVRGEIDDPTHKPVTTSAPAG